MAIFLNIRYLVVGLLASAIFFAVPNLFYFYKADVAEPAQQGFADENYSAEEMLAEVLSKIAQSNANHTKMQITRNGEKTSNLEISFVEPSQYFIKFLDWEDKPCLSMGLNNREFWVFFEKERMYVNTDAECFKKLEGTKLFQPVNINLDDYQYEVETEDENTITILAKPKNGFSVKAYLAEKLKPEITFVIDKGKMVILSEKQVLLSDTTDIQYQMDLNAKINMSVFTPPAYAQKQEEEYNLFYLLTDMMLKAKEYDLAEYFNRQAMDVMPAEKQFEGKLFGYIMEGDIRRTAGKFQEAMESYQKTSALSMNEIQTAMVNFKIGLCLFELDQKKEALEKFKTVLNTPESDYYVLALESIGNIYAWLGDREKALEYLNEALSKADYQGRERITEYIRLVE